ncbi:hypothetical protein HHI36_009342 [Cryptolaemus montrouzieri]|uniref:Magnesium transporter NIPA2 n=1 Tax=Cryptolaemus montrouzieri TaxID=559131 RepID=A0ABD2MVU2_9CUCU
MTVEVINLYYQGKNVDKYLIGVALAISSSVFIGSSFILKKISLLKLSKSSSLRAGAGGFGYLKDWMWWAGFLSMSIGEFLNLVAYGFAPASLVTSLGALSVLVSAVLASKFLQEHLTTQGKIGCVLCILGSIIIIFNAPKEVDLDSIALLGNLQKGPVIVYAIFIIFTSFFLMFFLGPKYGSRYIVIYCLLCSQVGSFTVMACKILVLSIRCELEGSHGGYQIIVISFLIVVVCACIQITYLNKALDFFGSAVVTPMYYVMFTTLVLLSSAVLFDEWKKMIFSDILGTLLGLLIAAVSIFSIHAKKKENSSFMMVESG